MQIQDNTNTLSVVKISDCSIYCIDLDIMTSFSFLRDIHDGWGMQTFSSRRNGLVHHFAPVVYNKLPSILQEKQKHQQHARVSHR
jgi:hypothetical protein